MKKALFFLAVFTVISFKTVVAQEASSVDHFDKVIISPYVQATLTKGDKESVTIQNCTVDRKKVHIESNGKTLRVYLEGAKEITKNEKVNENGHEVKKPLYNGTVLTVAITYKYLNDLSIRGEEIIRMNSKVEQEDFDLTIYGNAQVYFGEVQLRTMSTTIYGESHLELKSGNITEQKFTAYGESKVNAVGVKNITTKATLYGEAELKLNVSDLIKVTAFGNAKIGYLGNPEIRKFMTVGNAKIYKIN